jgi:hypothetical protein
MKTPLVCTAYPPGTPNNPTDVLDLTVTEETIRLTIRRDGKVSLDLKWHNDQDGRENAEAMMGDLTRHSFRAPTEEELRTVPDLMSSIADAKPADALLCIQWDIDGRCSNDALDLRNRVMEWAEQLLDGEGLLVDWEGSSIGGGTVETTFCVSDFEQAKTLLWDSLPVECRAHNCRIFDVSAA